MIFTIAERRLLYLYCSGSAKKTSAVVTDALPDITDPDERAAAYGLLRKLETMSGAEFDSFDIFEREVSA